MHLISTKTCVRCKPNVEHRCIESGDRFGILIDLEKKECSFKYNGKIVQKTHRNIPKKVAPTFTLLTAMEITCNQWELK